LSPPQLATGGVKFLFTLLQRKGENHHAVTTSFKYTCETSCLTMRPKGSWWKTFCNCDYP
jgi:hypothetical protein